MTYSYKKNRTHTKGPFLEKENMTPGAPQSVDPDRKEKMQSKRSKKKEHGISMLEHEATYSIGLARRRLEGDDGIHGDSSRHLGGVKVGDEDRIGLDLLDVCAKRTTTKRKNLMAL